MTINERLKHLRKDILKLSGEEFGKRIGLKRNSVSQLETGKNSLTEQNIKLICKEFNINEEWLRNGIGEIYIEQSSFSLDEFAKAHGCTDFELKIIKTYFELDPELREKAVKHFKERLFDDFEDKTVLPDNAADFEKLYPPVNIDTEDVG